MKAKKIALLLAGILSAASLAACTDNDKHVLFNSYWQYDSLARGEQVNETLTYAVTYEAGAGNEDLSYTFTYGTGSYVTTLQKNADRATYTYVTKLTMPVSFEVGDETATFEDSVVTAVSFADAGESLRPISSTKTVISHTPTNSKATKIDDCYLAHNYTLETVYTREGKGTSTVTYNDTEETESSTFEYGKGKYSYLDNEQLLLALRGISTDVTSGSIQYYNPFLKTTQRVNLSFDDTVSGEFSHTVNGEDLAVKEISYRPITLTINSKNPGATQTAWVATTDTPGKNVHRNVMLYLETPLSYNLGALTYNLTSVQNS